MYLDIIIYVIAFCSNIIIYYYYDVYNMNINVLHNVCINVSII